MIRVAGCQFYGPVIVYAPLNWHITSHCVCWACGLARYVMWELQKGLP